MRMAKIMALTAARAHYTSIALYVSGEITTMTVRGRVVCGVSSAGFLMDAVTRAAKRDTRVISLNLRDIYQIDAAGIGVLAFGYSTAKSAGIRFELENTPGFIVDLLKICHLDTILLPSGAPQKGICGTAA